MKINQVKKLVERDFSHHPGRWQWLFIIFITVYFGEVVLAKVTGTLTSPERQFMIYWLLASVTLLIPFELSVLGTMAGTLGLMLITYLRPGSLLVTDLGVWTLFFLFTATVVAFIKQKADA